ncbi:MAG: tetratricopeptide repeat protein [Anaerolineae bacterium]|jgi:tetratricopeptide (TPR) repeat protein
MDSPFAIPLIGLLYLLGFGGLSLVRGQGLSVRFAIEGLIITVVGTALRYASVPLHPLLFLVVLYLVTMRVRLLVDLGNWLSGRGRCDSALRVCRLALRLGPDAASRRLVLINCGVAQLRQQDPEAAHGTLTEALADEDSRKWAKHLAACYYNLGLACRRSGREAEAVRRFNEAIEAWPGSVYGEAAKKALEKGGKDSDSASE